MADPTTVYQLLRERADVAPDDVAIEMAGTGAALTYRALLAESDRAAAALSGAGVRAGESLAVWLPNGIEWVVLELAAARLGALLVSLNTRYKPAEVTHLVGVADARVLVFAPGFHGIDFTAMVAEVLDTAAIERVITVGGPATELAGVRVLDYRAMLDAAPAEPAGRPGAPDDLINVFGTSGTTSSPKLAAHRQDTIARHAVNVARRMGLGPGDRMLCVLPFCGVLGFVGLTAILAAGGRAVVLPVYTHQAAARAVADREVTVVFATQPMLRGMFEAAPEPAAFASCTRAAVPGPHALALSRPAARRYGMALVNPYGSSEVLALAALAAPDDPIETRAVAGGRLVGPGMRARAADPASGRVLPDGEPGELQFSGYNVMSGYLANERGNAEAFTADGWYRSGDRGRVVGDTVEYESRMADTLRLRGYLVSPAEIEEFLLSHDAVAQAQVVGVRDEQAGGERAVAFVRRAAGADASAEDLREYCRLRLARWKVPDLVVFVDGYPTTPGANGDKIQRSKLRELAGQAMRGRR